jgi:hypothetical protein
MLLKRPFAIGERKLYAFSAPWRNHLHITARDVSKNTSPLASPPRIAIPTTFPENLPNWRLLDGFRGLLLTVDSPRAYAEPLVSIHSRDTEEV